MLRPRMWAFTFDGAEPQELPLDIAAVPADAVCFFDSWHTVVLHTGSHVASWLKQARPSLCDVNDALIRFSRESGTTCATCSPLRGAAGA